ncbi:hypothetical protein [Hymenobacter sp. YC55]|uniref:hypothetical protein n=1 Tax=Hymenobacter sp. YC55 TaxID=3034019 RepID=UPI0023F91DD0|nr:hypothetical protein [Hymenobacter sp. YC55]MDF7810492.1 hypothetical protein [Hymenobacter sp. YC55]
MRKHSHTTTPPELHVIPVRRAVLKFLEKKLVIENNEPFPVGKKSQVGRMLYHLLRTPQDDRQYDCSAEQYPVKFVVSVSHHLSWLNGCRYLTPQAIHDFNRQVEDMIEEEFLNCLRVLRAYGVQVETKQFAKDFMSLYGFTEDDFSLDALIKAEYRRRKAAERLQKPFFLIPKCPVFPGPKALAHV